MSVTPERAAEIVAALPVELRAADIAAVLGVSANHVDRMKWQNRVPKTPDPRRAVWQREDIREWLVARLVNRDADVTAAEKTAKRARQFLGEGSRKSDRPPLFPFLGIY